MSYADFPVHSGGGDGSGWRRESDIARLAAQMIANGKIIGSFQGGSELGPRALGAHSIVALNHRIKHREPFRPFAPAVLADHARDWFDLDVPSPFMLLSPPVHPESADKIAGVVHADQTARVQTVDPGVAPAFGRARRALPRDHRRAYRAQHELQRPRAHRGNPRPTPLPPSRRATWTPHASGTTSSNGPERTATLTP